MQGTGQTAVFATAGLLAVVMVSTPRVAAAANSSSSTSPIPLGPTHAYSVAVAAGASCTIHPEGVTNDPRSATMIAQDDGKVRFDFASPAIVSAWGTRLTLDCVLSNASTTQLVDLNDGSTFTTESANDLAPKKTGVRPPLTGDPTSVTINQLLQGHYPLRPDASDPHYAMWLKQVTTSINRYQAVHVTILGLHNTGPYKGGWTQVDENWAGFIQAASGFTFDPGPYANGSFLSQDLYGGYEAFMRAPEGLNCFSGNSCDPSSYWAGTGGAWVSGFGTFSPALLQSGFTYQIQSGFPQLTIFDEYYPGEVNAFMPPPSPLNPGDVLLVEGYDGDANCNYTTSQPTSGCFIFENCSEPAPYGWVLDDWPPQPFPTIWPPGTPQAGQPVTWLPATAEYISEWHGGGTNMDATGVVMEGQALDLAGNWHTDPGSSSATDPYVAFLSMDGNQEICCEPSWANGTLNTPEDPMYFTEYQCGPN